MRKNNSAGSMCNRAVHAHQETTEDENKERTDKGKQARHDATFHICGPHN